MTYSPILETNVSDPAEFAIVDSETFALYFGWAREDSDQVRSATSEFGGDITDSVYRLTLDGKSGYCVRPNGDLVYVFSTVKGRGNLIVVKAMMDGAETLDCFDGYLPSLYGRHGFVEYAREANWTAGEPDVVFMATPARLAR